MNVCEEIKLDYCNMIKRDSNNHVMHPFIRFTHERYSVLLEYGVDLWKMIKVNINKKRYIQVFLNEKYIKGLDAYNKHDFSHESLIYGYEDNGQKIKILV